VRDSATLTCAVPARKGGGEVAIDRELTPGVELETVVDGARRL